MLEFLAPTVLAMSFIAICLSAVSLSIHWSKRGTPTTESLSSQVEGLRLAQIDVVDRLEHWTRRDRVRRLRDRKIEDAEGEGDQRVGEGAAGGVDEQHPEVQQQGPVHRVLMKAQLREIARQRGILK